MNKVWATVIAVIAGLAAALKLSNSRVDKYRDTLDREREDRQVEQEKHDVERSIQQDIQQVSESAPVVDRRDRPPSGAFGDPRLKERDR